MNTYELRIRERLRRMERDKRKAKRQEFFDSVRFGVYFMVANILLVGWYLFLSFVEPYSWRHLPYALLHALSGIVMGFIVRYRRRSQRKRSNNDGDRRDTENDPGGTAEGAVGDSGTEAFIPAKGGVITQTGITITIPRAGIYSIGGSIPSASTGAGGRGSASVTQVEFEAEKELEVYTAPLIGFRSWSGDGAYPTLSGYGSYTWKKGRNEALCGGIRASRSYEHDAPCNFCLCGFHAKKTILDAINYSSGILGGVVGWGKVIEATDGWRSQYAAIAAIMERPVFLEDAIQANMPLMGSSLPTRAGWLAKTYDVPLCHSFEELEAEAQKLADWMAGQDLT